MVSIGDGDQRAGVSVATVSRAGRDVPDVATHTRQRAEASAMPADRGSRATDHHTTDRLGHPAPSA